MRALRDLALTAALLAFVAPFFLTPYGWTISLAGWIGRTLLPRSPFAGRVRDNLALVRPDLDPAQVAAAVGDNFARTIAEYVRMGTLARRPDLIHATGLEHLRAAVAAGRGVLLISAHFGNWEAARLAARAAGVEVGIIYRRFNNRPFDAVALARIRLAGAPVLWKGRSGQRTLLRHLKDGGAMLILLDQRLGDGTALPFLGRPARTALAAAALAARTGAALLPVHARRRADGLSFDVTFEPPVAAATPEAAMTAIHARYAAWIDEAPGQWFWLHRRWK